MDGPWSLLWTNRFDRSLLWTNPSDRSVKISNCTKQKTMPFSRNTVFHIYSTLNSEHFALLLGRLEVAFPSIIIDALPVWARLKSAWGSHFYQTMPEFSWKCLGAGLVALRFIWEHLP